MKYCLIVVDYQHDFVVGSLGFPMAQEIESQIIQKIIEYRTKGTVVFTLDTHTEVYPSTVEGTKLPVLHCLKGSTGHQVHGKIFDMIRENDLLFEKETFPSLKLANYLEQEQFDAVELCGLVSHICVFSNAVMAKAALPNAKIIVDRSATASYDEVLQEQAFTLLKALHMEVI